MDVQALNIYLKVFLWILGVIVTFAAAGAGLAVYRAWAYYQEYLDYPIYADWEWVNDYQRSAHGYQIRNGYVPMLRTVYLPQDRVIVATLNENDNLAAEVFYRADCTPGKTVETTQKWSNGEPKILRCAEWHGVTFLSIGALWSGSSESGYDVTWKEDINGFRFEIDFGDWPIHLLQQLRTAQAAK